jgi:16S rRNA (uracil1498-N3)-methyltransferase
VARRFFIEKDIKVGEKIEIAGEEAKHIMVLRHNIGEKILINDKICEIKNISKQGIEVEAIEEEKKIGIPSVNITLFQALLKSDKLEFVIQKAVELGVCKIKPFISKNVIVKLNDSDKIKKIDRWNKISKEASKQCGRSDIVLVENIISFNAMLEELQGYDLVLIAYENEVQSLKEVIQKNINAKNIAIIIGAEGGFEKDEVLEILKQENAKSVSLGSRILRAETASLNLISILMYEFDGGTSNFAHNMIK